MGMLFAEIALRISELLHPKQGLRNFKIRNQTLEICGKNKKLRVSFTRKYHKHQFLSRVLAPETRLDRFLLWNKSISTIQISIWIFLDQIRATFDIFLHITRFWSSCLALDLYESCIYEHTIWIYHICEIDIAQLYREEWMKIWYMWVIKVTAEVE